MKSICQDCHGTGDLFELPNDYPCNTCYGTGTVDIDDLEIPTNIQVQTPVLTESNLI